jgi:hypothetical protein
VGKHRRIWVAAIVVVGLAVALWATSGVPAPTPNPPGTFSFAVLGDAPYYAWEDMQYRLVLHAVDAHDLQAVIHVGDILWRPCSDEMYRRRLGWFDGLRHPVVYTPGDNEWADCHEPGSGGFAPLERLARIRQIFFDEPTRSRGRNALALDSQSSREGYAEFVENARWEHGGVVFATVHLVGSRNGPDEVETKRRTEAAAAWLGETFAVARDRGASAVVIAFHANPDFEARADNPYRLAFEPFLSALEEEVERFGKPVLIVHGDRHEYLVDHPLARRTTGQRLENLTRLQVPGSPDVGWVRVVVNPGASEPFGFEGHVVPRWKFW